jgi:YidC/Oxa1 family membrane protein insertase
MADPTNGGNQSKSQPKELSMEIRLLIALVLMLAVLFGTPYFFKAARITPPQAPPERSGETKPAAAPASPPVTPAPAPPAQAAPAAATKTAAKTPAAPRPSGVAAQSEQEVVIDTDMFRVAFTNRGAVVKSWVLKKYKDSLRRPLDLVNPNGAVKAGAPLSVISKNQAAASTANGALFAVKKSEDGLGVEFEFSNTRTTVKKILRFQKSGFLASLSSELTDSGVPVPHLLAWRGGFGDLAVPNIGTMERVTYYDGAANKLLTNEAKVAKDGPVSISGSFHFAGVEDNYFAALFLPSGSGALEVETFSDSVPPPGANAEIAFVGVAVGGEGQNRLSLFVGPKDLDILKQVNPRLTTVVDFGWLSFLAQPLFLMVHWLNDAYVHNYGWSIIIATIVINMALLPLKFSSLKSMKKMQMLQPQINAINEKYKNIGMRDPRKQQQNQDVMALYQKNGVNPLGGCIPLLLQMPLLFAFYKVFTIAIEMRQASWLWVTDLSQAETLAVRILPIAFIGSQFFLSKMTPPTGGDPAQQKVMQYMPLFMGVMFYGVSSGLMLYWVTGNLVAIAQQWFFNRTMTPADLAPAAASGKKQGKK